MNQIVTGISRGVMHVVIERPERKNSLTGAMYSLLAQAVDSAEQDAEVKVLLLSGASGIFTAGNDLEDFVQNPPKDMDSPVFKFVTKLANLSKPVVAAVEGLAIGIGTTMLLHCDLVYVGENTRFSLPFVGLGLVPEAASSLLLPRLAGHQRASERLLFGDMFSTQEAVEMGFVNRVLPAGEVLTFARQQCERLALLPAHSVRGTKALIKGKSDAKGAGRTNELHDRIRAEVEIFCERVKQPAFFEAVAAFKEKRKPNFEGKD